MASTSRHCARFFVPPLGIAAPLLMACGAQAQPQPAAGPVTELQPIQAIGRRDRSSQGSDSYTVESSRTATPLDLTLRETPQSLSVVPRALIDDFSLHEVNDLLAGVTGINVERVEPDRSYFSVRGFEVSNFQIDGMGLPFATGDQIGNLDSVLYDRVEVLRGANGLMSSTGNPSATVNFVRRRPTAELGPARH